MSMSDENEYYAYSSDEDDNDVFMSQNDDDEDDDTSLDPDEKEAMALENPNAAPVQSSFYTAAVPSSPTTATIRMMKTSELWPTLQQRCDEVTEMLGVSQATAMALLQSYQFSKERLMESYTNDDPETIWKRAGVYHRCSGNQNPEASAADMCPICMEDASPTSPLKAMPCGHAFCGDCWTDFAVNLVQHEGRASSTCPHAGCPEVVTQDEIQPALEQSHPNLWNKYQQFQLKAFVEANTLTRWCPGPGCERIAWAPTASAMDAAIGLAHCDHCDTRFCMMCGHNEPHRPVPCRSLQVWHDKCRDESETANWILANTKECPSCVTRIEKNNGCNHMTCQKCRHEFCWICMGDWREHDANTGGYYKCNKYDASQEGGSSDTDAARRQLNRYLHYYKRYHAHEEGQKFALKQLRETEQRMIQWQELSSSKVTAKWSDVEFLKVANELLVECRRVLKYTYVYAYYAFEHEPANSLTRDRFEYHQEMLEKFTEHLSELSEKPLEQMNRTDVVNQTRVVDRFLQNILKYVEDGMEEAA
ncbi:ariadne-1 [Fistulifera solaris]|uniref:RBR-type E3 ubiquitin transferase n=1 Tax=Fistulifera solaris TaxID=1519565 RepID=A0A1Z5KCH4_FISSO|nr:ariadne-1 [Fistulifera solaris]|eukprot:GAX23832.1 ariadne-1 [Fistulifera solaris]